MKHFDEVEAHVRDRRAPPACALEGVREHRHADHRRPRGHRPARDDDLRRGADERGPDPDACHQQNQTPVGVCRVCVVDVGARVYAAACIRECDPGMVVKTNVEPVQQARKTLVELLMSDHPRPARQQASSDCELETMWAQMAAPAAAPPIRAPAHATRTRRLLAQHRRRS